MITSDGWNSVSDVKREKANWNVEIEIGIRGRRGAQRAPVNSLAAKWVHYHFYFKIQFPMSHLVDWFSVVWYVSVCWLTALPDIIFSRWRCDVHRPKTLIEDRKLNSNHYYFHGANENRRCASVGAVPTSDGGDIMTASVRHSRRTIIPFFGS